MHAHRCKSCGRVWFHSSEMRGVEAAHKCICGVVQWEQFRPAAQSLAVGNAAHGHNHDHSIHDTITTVLMYVGWGLIIIGAAGLVWQIAINIRNAKLQVSA